MAKFFVSYARIDVVLAEQIIEVLRQRYSYANVWYDQELHNRGGEYWWEEILDAIGQADIFIYLLSKESVESPYCQAEFEEAQRLKKRLIFIQVRDRTPLPAIIASRQYTDMSKGVGNLKTWTSLYNSIDHQISKIPKRKPRPLKPERTPRPQQSESSSSRPADAPAETTPKLEPVTFDEVHDPTPKPQPPLPIVFIIAIVMVIGVLMIGFVIASSGGGNTNAITPTDTEPVIVQVNTPLATKEPTPTDEPEPSVTPTELPIVLIVGTLDAQATRDQATAYVEETIAARLTEYALQTQQVIDATATATLWTDTPTPDITASIEAFRTEQAQTETQAWVDSWTNTPTATATPTATPNATATLMALRPAANKDWVPVEQEFDGVAMVLVPASCFEMGSKDGDSDEKPVHEQCFDAPFWIDKYEVTQADFDRLGGTQTTAPHFSGDQRPVEKISWFEARDFCELRSSRLPTEAEWEYAARGPDSLVYPWGDTWDADNTVWKRSDTQGTANVGSIPAGISWVGALDMSGNVWEWTSSLYKDYPYDPADGREADTGTETDVLRVLRGGSWLSGGTGDLRSAVRNGYYPYNSYDNYGFRCARSYD
ncbi:hypothetical protein MASR2M15_27980 [Anaerolineales bacterium]